MLIAQISDLHIGFDRSDPNEPNLLRLKRVLARIASLDPLPDLLIASGDLTEHGDADSYRRLAEALEGFPIPVRLMMGNHDLRPAFREVFPDGRKGEEAVQSVYDHPELRCILLDTLEPGRHGGAFDGARASWLAKRLAEAPGRPTLIFLHHPPVGIGIPWMDPSPHEPWIERLRTVLAGARQVIGLATGHVHRSAVVPWNGLPLAICPSTAPEVGLVLTPIDSDQPDGRSLIEEGEPGFTLHDWDGERLVSHFAACNDRVLARFDKKLQPLIQMLMAERAEAAPAARPAHALHRKRMS